MGHKGWPEKDLVLDIVERLGKLVEEKLSAEVIYTRRDDCYLPLEKRATIHGHVRFLLCAFWFLERQVSRPALPRPTSGYRVSNPEHRTWRSTATMGSSGLRLNRADLLKGNCELSACPQQRFAQASIRFL